MSFDMTAWLLVQDALGQLSRSSPRSSWWLTPNSISESPEPRGRSNSSSVVVMIVFAIRRKNIGGTGRKSVKSQVLDQQTLDDIIRRIVEVAQPEQIVLFGSAARGT